MSANADLATLLALLADYGRPNLHQVSGSATPGVRTAGLWFCEVGIHGMGATEAATLSDADQATYWQTGMHVGARCTGYDTDPTEAARKCLAFCQSIMESDRGRFLRPVSKTDAMATEVERERTRAPFR